MDNELQYMLGQLSAKVDGNCKAIDEVREAQGHNFNALSLKLDALAEKHSAQRDVMGRVLGGLAIVVAVVFKVPSETVAAWFHIPPIVQK